jgi:hypothetical protein
MSENDSRRDSKNAPADAPESASNTRTGRRDFLRYAGLSFAAVTLPDWLSGCAPSGGTGEALGSVSAQESLDLPVTGPWVTAVRADDLLSLRFNFVQMQIAGKQLELVDPSKPGIILVEFPPQHIVEPTFDEPVGGGQPMPGTRPIDARIAQPSRLAFFVPKGTAPFTYDLDELLHQCTLFALNVAQNAVDAADDKLTPILPGTNNTSSTPDEAIAAIGAVNRFRDASGVRTDTIFPDAAPATTPPAPGASVAESETSIELPYRLILSPSSGVRFAHSSTPVQSMTSGRTEIWTSRLARVGSDGVSADETTRVPVSVRAVASPDIATAVNPFSTSHPDQNALHAVDRLNIVASSSDFTTSAKGPTYPMHARQLLLSARGGTLDVLANFDRPKTNLLSWQHRASMGRDNYVRVEDIGFLFPWGHAASLITISERKFLANPGNGAGPRTAFLWKRQFVLIREPLFDYNIGRPVTMPFRTVRILTPSTPPIDPAPTMAPFYFFPTINGFAVRFAAQLVDLETNVLTANIAAIFVPGLPTALTSSDLLALQALWQGTTGQSADPGGVQRASTDFQRQRVAYAPTDASTAPPTVGKTTFETQTIVFGVDLPTTAPPPPPGNPVPEFSDRLPQFVPVIQTTQVSVESLRHFTGKDTALLMSYAKPYTDNDGFRVGNPGEVFLSLVDGQTPPGVDFGAQSQKAGAFLTPNMSIIGLSRQVGPIAGMAGAATDIPTQISNLASGTANPSLLFGSLAGTKLFGCFTLGDLFGNPLPFASLPSFATKALDAISTVVHTLNQAQLAVAEIQNAATSAQKTASTDLQNAITELNNFQNKVSAFVTAIGNLPPTPDVPTFLNNITSSIKDAAVELGTMQSVLSQARKTNATLPLNVQLPDSLFGSADAFLRSASGMLPTTGIPPKLPAAGLPQEITDALNAVAQAANAVSNMSSSFQWSVPSNDIKAIDVLGIPQIFYPSDDASNPCQLTIKGEVRTHEVAGKPAGLDITANLTHFDINLVGVGGQPTVYHKNSPSKTSDLAFMALSFDHLTFTAAAGQKPSIDVGFKDITFQGPVSFLNGLKNIIPLSGFGDPPGITVDSGGIHANFTVALPSLGLGVFSLENLSLGAGFDIPFIGQPMTVGFHFSERQNPFHLTVSLLGGGGYFLMDLSLQGVQLIEAALEFGAEASIDLVVASGSVLIMAGVYFRYDAAAQPTPGVQLTGYVRIAGSMSVIGLITASVELRLDLGYKDGNAFGEATLSIEVSIMFFSASVDIHAEKSFSSKNGDPTFVDVMCPGATPGTLAMCSATGTPWDEYCNAFAA